MSITKLDKPLVIGGKAVYPQTSADQVIMSDGSRLETENGISVDNAKKLGGKDASYFASAEDVNNSIEGVNNSISEINTTINTEISNKIPFSFGIDSNGNYGYIKEGADTVTPFKYPFNLMKSNILFDGVFNEELSSKHSATLYEMTVDNAVLKANAIEYAGLSITNNSGTTVTYFFLTNIEKTETMISSCGAQIGYGTGSLPTMNSTGANRTSFVAALSNTNVQIVSYAVPSGYTAYLSQYGTNMLNIYAVLVI